MKLKNWSVFQRDESGFLPPELHRNYLQGDVYGNPKFRDGEFVTTSRIINIVDKGTHKEAETWSGSIYELHKEDVDPNAEKQFPNYYERLEIKSI